MDKLRIYVCGHSEHLDYIPTNIPYLRKINLNHLDIGKYQDNRFAENRIFLSPIIDEPVEYIGFLSQMYRHKWPQMASFQSLKNLDFQQNNVFYAELSWPKWATWFKTSFPGIEPFFDDMVQHSGLSDQNYPTFLANNFICPWRIFEEFIQIWRKNFLYLNEKYPNDCMNFEVMDKNRTPGYLYEALTTLIFSHLIKKYNLNLLKMQENKKSVKRIMVRPTLYN